jgi:SAM-dependent methyltransferase
MTRRLLFRKAPADYDEAFMDTMATQYLERTPWTELRLRNLKGLVEPGPGDRIIDLGCAAGALTHYFTTFGATVVGVDSEELAISKAQSLFPSLAFLQADVAELPFDDHAFNKAVAGDLVEHLDDSTFRAMLAELRRVLTPGGCLSIYTPNPLHLIERLKDHNILLAQNPTHIGLRTSSQLASILRDSGYAVDRTWWTASFFPVFRVIEKPLGRYFQTFRYRLCVRACTNSEAPAAD